MEASSGAVLEKIVLNNFKKVVMLVKKRVEGWRVRERLRVRLKVDFNRIRLVIVILFGIDRVDGGLGACIARGVVEGLRIARKGVFSYLRTRLAWGNVRAAFTYLGDDEFRETALIDVVVYKRSRLQEMRVQLTLRFVVGCACSGLGLCMGVWILQCKWSFSYSANRHPLFFLDHPYNKLSSGQD